jgi:hypothetical protein
LSGVEQRERWVSVGRSGADGVAAGQEAARAAIGGGSPKLLLVFASDALDLAGVLGGAHAVAPDVPLIGCSTAGEIATDGPDDESVVAIGFGGRGFAAATAAGWAASGRLRQAGAEAAGCLAELPSDLPHRVLILLTDGLAGDQQEIVRGAYSMAGAGIPMVGGCAGDDMRMAVTRQMHGDEVLTNSVVAAGLASTAPIGIGVRHGWRRVGEPMLVTESVANEVFTIEDRPALDLYLERLDAPGEVRSDPAEFTRFASTHPLGLASRRGEEQVRFISGADFDHRSLTSIAEVPRGGLTWLMEGDDESVLGAAESACEAALEPLNGRSPLGMVAFDCIARRGVLGDRGIRAEIDRVATLGRGAPVAGFYTYGEIARTRGVSGFHNQTLVVLAVS